MSTLERRATAVAVDSSVEAPVVWVGASDGTGRRLGGAPIDTLRLFDGAPVIHMAVSPDGASVLAGDDDRSVVVVRVADGEVLERFRLEARLARGEFIGARRYATVDVERHGALWTPGSSDALRPSVICEADQTPIAFDDFGVADDGARLTLRVALRWLRWDVAGNAVTDRHRPVDGGQLAYLDGIAGLSRNGAWCFVHWDDLLVFDATTGAMVREEPTLCRALCGALADDGVRLVLGGARGEVALSFGPGGAPVVARVAPCPVTAVDLRRDGAVAAWIDEEGGFGVVDVGARTELIARDYALRALREEWTTG